MAVPAFTGWPEEALTFFTGLEADNSKAYFSANKAVYDGAIRAPFEALLGAAAAEFGEGRMFRPNRDTRFAADKSPYKTNGAAVISTPGAAYYLSLSADGVYAAAGGYRYDGDTLGRFREAVADKKAGGELARLVADLEGAGYEIGGAALSRVPRGYPPDHPQARFLKFKGISMWKGWPPRRWLATKAAQERIFDVWRAGTPLVRWLEKRVGAPAP